MIIFHSVYFIGDGKAIHLSKTYTQHPILFVHGANSDFHIWDTMYDRFIEDGWPSTLLFAKTLNDPSNTTILGVIADGYQIKLWVDEILNQTGASKIDIISHSMGAVSSRFYIKNLTGIDKVDDYVSLAGFNHGWDAIWVSQQSWYIPNTYIGESNSTFLINLNNGDETPGGVLNDTVGPRYMEYCLMLHLIVLISPGISLGHQFVPQKMRFLHPLIHRYLMVLII